MLVRGELVPTCLSEAVDELYRSRHATAAAAAAVLPPIYLPALHPNITLLFIIVYCVM